MIKLNKEFPFGYCLFNVSNNGVVIPKSSSLVENYDIDWNAMHVTEETQKGIMIKFPLIIERKSNSVFTDSGLGIPKIINLPVNFFCMNGQSLIGEAVMQTPEGWFYVVGFAPCSLGASSGHTP